MRVQVANLDARTAAISPLLTASASRDTYTSGDSSSTRGLGISLCKDGLEEFEELADGINSFDVSAGEEWKRFNDRRWSKGGFGCGGGFRAWMASGSET